MRRIRLNHQYHDATLSSVQFSDNDVTFVADLDPHWNNKVPERGYLTFHGVKNADAIRSMFSCAANCDSVDVVDDIIGVARVNKTICLVDLQNTGPIEIDCRGVSEI